MEISRKAFLQNGLLAAAGLLAFSSFGCGGSNGSDTGSGGQPGSAPDCTTGVNADIQLNHGHVLTVSPDDVAAAVDKSYDIQGTALHTHTVTVTAADFAELEKGNTLTLTTSVGATHTHTVTVQCA